MNNPLENFKEGNNFWDFNPQYKVMFNDFYTNDKSRKKERSSNIMWALFLYIHPKSDFYNLNDKEERIVKDFLKDPKFEFVKYKDILDTIENSILTQAERSLIKWDKTLKKRDEFIHEQDFTLDEYDENNKVVKGTADQLDKMLANTSKLYQEYFKIQKQLEEDEYKTGRGNKPDSLSDGGDI